MLCIVWNLLRGVYLWGGVGRGKSFLMDSFYLCVPLVKKRRVHFHHFMRDVHQALDDVKGEEDPLELVAKDIAAQIPPDLLRRIPRLRHRRCDDPGRACCSSCSTTV